MQTIAVLDHFNNGKLYVCSLSAGVCLCEKQCLIAIASYLLFGLIRVDSFVCLLFSLISFPGFFFCLFYSKHIFTQNV